MALLNDGQMAKIRWFLLDINGDIGYNDQSWLTAANDRD